MTEIEKEEIAKEWIRNNPHMAVVYSVFYHEKFTHGCKCVIAVIAELLSLK